VAHIEGLWHTTAMARQYDDLFGPLQHLFGAVVMHDHVSEDPAVGRRGGMIWLGDNSIEIGAPVGDRSPVRGFVDKMGGGMHSIALRVADVAATRQRLAEHGVEPVAYVSDDIFFTRPAETAGLLLEWSAMHTDDDPRWGFPLAERVVAPVAPATQYAFVTAAVADPVAVAEQLATLFGTDVPRLVPDAAAGEIAAVVSLLDCLLVLFALPADGATWPWGPTPTRPRFHGHGLVVENLADAVAALGEVGVRPVATLEHMVLLDAAAGPVPTFLCDELLPEDPRRRLTATVR
jgi:hypothetical protein